MTRHDTTHDTTRHGMMRHDTTRHDTTRHDMTRHDAATSARLRSALRSISSTRVLHTSRPGQRGTSAGNQQWIHTSCTIHRSRKTLRENRPYYSRNTLRGRPAILNLLTTNRRRLPLPPRQLPLLRGQTRGQRRIVHQRRSRAARSRCPLAPPVHIARSRRSLASPSRAARSRRPLAPSPRAARLRRPLAPPARAQHAVLLVLRDFGDAVFSVRAGQHRRPATLPSLLLSNNTPPTAHRPR